jgi:osmotically inducible protein OsmC
MRLGSGAFDGPYSFGSRFEDSSGTNPEELIGAAFAGCFSMALSGGLERAGHPPAWVATAAAVTIERGETGFEITRIDLDCTAEVPGLDDAGFQALAATAKATCPVSVALAGVDVHLDARLAG